MLSLLANLYRFYGIAKVIFDLLYQAYSNPELRKLIDSVLAELKKLSPADLVNMSQDVDPNGPTKRFLDYLKSLFKWSTTPYGQAIK
jgi:aromatic ring-opening dioxygenase catalytic subunit (LigB family)